MALAEEKIYTIDDIYLLPDGERAELIDGRIYYMAPPSTVHQRIVMKISTVIANYINANQGSCEVFQGPFAVFLGEYDKNYVEPDISVICDSDKVNEKGCLGAPDWIVEVVSPSSRKMDYNKKLFKYRTACVREYWIVDPGKKRILVYDFENDDMGEFTFEDTIPVGIFSGLSIDMAEFKV
jgi:Uncharacterized protein conserved in cyanobacteria